MVRGEPRVRVVRAERDPGRGTRENAVRQLHGKEVFLGG